MPSDAFDSSHTSYKSVEEQSSPISHNFCNTSFLFTPSSPNEDIYMSRDMSSWQPWSDVIEWLCLGIWGPFTETRVPTLYLPSHLYRYCSNSTSDHSLCRYSPWDVVQYRLVFYSFKQTSSSFWFVILHSELVYPLYFVEYNCIIYVINNRWLNYAII